MSAVQSNDVAPVDPFDAASSGFSAVLYSIVQRITRGVITAKLYTRREVSKLRYSLTSTCRRLVLLEAHMASSIALSRHTASRFLTFDDRPPKRIFTYIFDSAHSFALRMHYCIGRKPNPRVLDARNSIVQLRVKSSRTQCTLEECRFVHHALNRELGERLSVRPDEYVIHDERPSAVPVIALIFPSYASFASVTNVDLTARRGAIGKFEWTNGKPK